MRRHSFSNIELKHAASCEALNALNILTPYYAPESMNYIDLVTPWTNGGTFLSNWNLTVADATVAVEVLQEMDCAIDCFFIIPVPSWKGFPEAHQQKKIYDILALYSSSGIASNDKFLTPFPPYFAIHCTSPNFGCIKIFKELVLVKLMEATPSKELKTLERLVEFQTSILLNKYTLAGNKSE